MAAVFATWRYTHGNALCVAFLSPRVRLPTWDKGKQLPNCRFACAPALAVEFQSYPLIHCWSAAASPIIVLLTMAREASWTRKNGMTRTTSATDEYTSVNTLPCFPMYLHCGAGALPICFVDNDVKSAATQL